MNDTSLTVQKQLHNRTDRLRQCDIPGQTITKPEKLGLENLVQMTNEPSWPKSQLNHTEKA